MSLQNKVALVSAAADAVAGQCAHDPASLGAAVVIADRNPETAQKVAPSFAASGREAIAVSMDLTNEDAASAGIARTAKEPGSIDMLISNARTRIVATIEAKLQYPETQTP